MFLYHITVIFYFKSHLVLAHLNCSLPFKIASNISIKKYNKFLESRKPSGYKLEYNNGSVIIIDMCTRVHEAVVALLQDYFKIPNGGVIINPPIVVRGQPCKKIQACLIFDFLWIF